MPESRKFLSDLLGGVDVRARIGTTDLLVSDLAFDFRKVTPGSIFVALSGPEIDSHKFIDVAISAGASTIVCERLPDKHYPNTTVLRVEKSSTALGILAANYFDHPSKKLRLIGVTGTNGKTTIATLLHRIALSLKYRSGLFSTIQNEINTLSIPATATTPDSLELNRLMSAMVSSGCSLCFMEVTSHGIHQDRIAGLNFAGALFTNLTHDHLDYHNSFGEYFRVKKSFFDNLGPNAFALTNKDDPRGLEIVADSVALSRTYSLVANADYTVELLENSLSGIRLKLGTTILTSKLIGRFNAYNIATVWGACDLLGFPLEEVKTAIEKLDPVPGRFQWTVSCDNVLGVVDFAHTPNALENVLRTAREVRPDGKLITVFGCGGNRDEGKRPLMGKLAVELSDFTIVTSDNPRKEDPAKIIYDICGGIPQGSHDNRVIIVSDRVLAIRTACERAENGDTVVVAGRGHERHQERYSDSIVMQDITVLRKFLGLNVRSPR